MPRIAYVPKTFRPAHMDIIQRAAVVDHYPEIKTYLREEGWLIEDDIEIEEDEDDAD